jgi:protein transport protein SEC61 subunit gamma and related proteins
MESQQFQQEQPSKLKRFIKETVRVLRLTKRPGKVEYVGLVKVTGLGILIIGAIGFVIFLTKQLLL